MTLQGIDVSHYQTVSDYEAHLGPLTFFFARASIGTARDDAYGIHIACARRAGITRLGAYHFNANSLSIADQVRVFLAAAGDVPFLFIDVEGEHAFSQAQTKDFISRVHAEGRTIGLYHSTSGYFEAGQDYRWVADYRKGLLEPPIRWDFWQYGPYYGVDGNVFNGSLARLDGLAQRETDLLKVDIDSEAALLIDIPVTATIYDLAGQPMDPAHLSVAKLGELSVYANLIGGVEYRYISTGLRGSNELAMVKTSQITNPRPYGGADPDQLAAATLAGRRAEWDRQNTGADVTLAPRP